MSKKRALIILVPVSIVGAMAVNGFLAIRQIGDFFPKSQAIEASAPEWVADIEQQIPTSVTAIASPNIENPVPTQDSLAEFQIEAPEVESTVVDDAGVALDNLATLDPPLSIEERCVLMRDVNVWLFYGTGRVGSRAVQFYSSIGETELMARADIEDDGFAQYFFAQNLLQEYIAGFDQDGLSESSRDAVVAEIREYFAKAIRKQIKGRGPYNLAWLAYGLGDRTEAAAWLAIDERMGGDGFEDFRMNALRVPDGFFILDPYDVSEGAKRAEELIAEYDLAPGLLPSEDCIGVVQ